MINQDRVRQMSRLAMLEADLEKEEGRVSSYHKADYVIVQIVRGFIAGTVCFAALCLLWLCVQWDALNEVFYEARFDSYLFDLLKIYGIFMIVYLVICMLVALHRYKICKKKKKQYLKYLHALNKSYLSDTDAAEEISKDTISYNG